MQVAQASNLDRSHAGWRTSRSPARSTRKHVSRRRDVAILSLVMQYSVARQWPNTHKRPRIFCCSVRRAGRYWGCGCARSVTDSRLIRPSRQAIRRGGRMLVRLPLFVHVRGADRPNGGLSEVPRAPRDSHPAGRPASRRQIRIPPSDRHPVPGFSSRPRIRPRLKLASGFAPRAIG